jgi:ArsR family transcriptional regulator, nickel/cobalt-responsive transcriptional repressor
MSHARAAAGPEPNPLDPDAAHAVAATMQALATASRVRILARLAKSQCTVSELSTAVGMEQSAVSHQLRVLRHLGLVVGERRGRNVRYALHDEHVGSLLEEAVAHTEHIRLGLAAPTKGPSAVTA